jgi:hypothetical protein
MGVLVVLQSGCGRLAKVWPGHECALAHGAISGGAEAAFEIARAVREGEQEPRLVQA